jgi:transcriptional regulator with XRE-family HTH domain
MRSMSEARSSPVGALLKRWRLARHMSQLALALEAEVSTRHISFIENGRANPSREMLLILASVLEVPLRERNALLAAGGFTAAYGRRDLDDEDMAPVRRAIEFLLARHEPYGAVVVDGRWNLLHSNEAATRLTMLFCDDPIAASEGQPPNLLRLLLHPRGVRAGLTNWEEVARETVRRARRELASTGDEELAALLDEVLGYPGVPSHVHRVDLTAPSALMVPMHLVAGELELRLFTTITTLGTAQDVTLQELRIEGFFPADEETDAKLRDLAEPRRGA